MKVIEKPMREGFRYAFANVDPEYLDFKKGVRVLPAAYFHEPKISFELIARYEPGENRFFPDGGFEVRGPSSEIRSFFLDQVIVHPYALNKRMPRTSSVTTNGGEITVKAKYVPTGGARGRKPLSPEEREARELAKAEASARSNGRRGRPKKDPSELKSKPYVPKGTKRGRPKMDPALKKSTVYVKSGKPRGRPSKKK